MQLSTLTIFFANVTYWGHGATSYLARRAEHIVGAVETHLRGEKSSSGYEKLQGFGLEDVAYTGGRHKRGAHCFFISLGFSQRVQQLLQERVES